MSLTTNNTWGAPEKVAVIKQEFITEFHRPKLEDQFMNEMVEVRKKERESVWDIDQNFKKLKDKLKYPIFGMQHKQLFINYLLPHFKYPLK